LQAAVRLYGLDGEPDPASGAYRWPNVPTLENVTFMLHDEFLGRF